MSEEIPQSGGIFPGIRHDYRTIAQVNTAATPWLLAPDVRDLARRARHCSVMVATSRTSGCRGVSRASITRCFGLRRDFGIADRTHDALGDDVPARAQAREVSAGDEVWRKGSALARAQPATMGARTATSKKKIID